MTQMEFFQRGLGRYSDAERIGQQAVQLTMERFGEMHQATMNAIASLAITLSKQGRFREAQVYEDDVLSFFKGHLGPHHSATIQAVGNLAVTWRNLGQLEQVEAIVSQKILGEKNLQTIMTMDKVAFAWYHLGRLGDADSLFEDVSELHVEIMGVEHPSIDQPRTWFL